LKTSRFGRRHVVSLGQHTRQASDSSPDHAQTGGFSFFGVKYVKPPLTCEQQADLVLSRGMIADRAELISRLRVVGYYRLSAYCHPFKQPDNNFHAGTQFGVVWSRYRFDRHLRLAVMDAIERVEVATRSVLITELAMVRGAFAHLDPQSFPSDRDGKHAKLANDRRDAAAKSREVFVDHFKARYDEFPNLPIWAAAETMSFGTLLTMYRISSREARNTTARSLGQPEPVFASWLHTMNYVRNICAHHARLWNRELAIKPMIPHDRRWHGEPPVGNNRVFAVLTLLHQLLLKAAPGTGWRTRLFSLFDEFPDIPFAAMQIPQGWRDHVLWS
jgi:abortive infection bacteriophage resistance protein